MPSRTMVLILFIGLTLNLARAIGFTFPSNSVNSNSTESVEATATSSSKDKEVLHPEHSVNDNRNYMIITLSNGLRLLVITDPAAEKSACAISVRIGSLADPDRSLGLAHFLQHMLFMGSAKFPVQNEYSEFISKNAGYDNAFTDDLQTNYYFEIATDKFVEGVERLSDFFKSASLNPDSVERARQAVHQEYVLWTNDDSSRKWAILRDLGHGQFSRFFIGNQQTLKHENIHADLKNFYETYYSANMINAVLMSNMPFEELLNRTKYLLQAIPNKNAQPPEFDVPYLPEQLGKLIRMQSIKEEQVMEFDWVVENLLPLFKNHIDEYLIHILGHEDENSVLGVLKQHGYANSATAFSNYIVHATIIGLEIHLTQKGYENYEDVYNIIIKYLTQLQPSQSVYEEILTRNRLFFDFQDKQVKSTYVSTLAQRMQNYPHENVLNYFKVAKPFDEQLFRRVFKQLTPERLLVVLSSSSKVENSKVEKYLGASYRLDELPRLSKEPLESTAIPINQFLPVDTAILPEDVAASPFNPKKLMSNVVFLPDKVFRGCKGGVSLHVYSNDDKINQELYSRWLKAMLRTHTYAAETLKTGISYESGVPFSIGFYGFSDVLLKLLKEFPQLVMATTSKQLEEKARRIFKLEQENLLQEYRNALLKDTNEVAADYLKRILRGKNGTTIEQDIKTLEGLTVEGFLSFARAFWKNARVEWVFVGNFKDERIVELAKNFQSQLQTNQELEKDELGCLKVEKPLSVDLKIPSDGIKTSAAVVYYQYGPTNSHLQVVFKLISNYIQEPFFNELRTLKQLAYLVRTNVYSQRGVIGLTFSIVSSNTDPSSVGKQMREFIAKYLQKLSQQTEKQLETLKQSVLVSLTEPHHSLNDQFDFVNKQVSSRSFRFDGKQKSVVDAELKRITKEDILNVVRELLGRSVSVYVVAKTHEESYKANTSDKVSEFAEVKASHTFYQDNIRRPLSSFETLSIQPQSTAAGIGISGAEIKQSSGSTSQRPRLAHKIVKLSDRWHF